MTDPLELTLQQLRRQCPPDHFKFKDTSELPGEVTIFGQKRGVEAIEFGIDINVPGYNLYVLGPAGSGRLTAVQHFINDRAKDDPTPDDWCYVNNFKDEHKPVAIRLAAGQGREFKADVEALIEILRSELARVFDSETYMQARSNIANQAQKENQMLLERVHKFAGEKGFVIQPSQQGFLMILPILDGEPIKPEAYENMSDEQKKALEAARAEVEEALAELFHATRQIQTAAQTALDSLTRETASQVIDAQIGDVLKKYDSRGRIIQYFHDLRDDLLDVLDEFHTEASSAETEQAKGQQRAPDFKRRYSVNVLVERTPNSGAPVILLDLPTYQNLVGRIEHEVRFGMLSTDFTLIKSGALHRANGGFLIIRALDILRQPFAWEALKRALTSHKVRIEDADSAGMSVMATRQLEPEPIPIELKVVLVGDPQLYYALYSLEESFPDLFRVKADFVDMMERTPENEAHYADFIATRCKEEGLRHFSAEAVARVVDYGSWLVSDQERLSTQFGLIVPLIYESVFFAKRSGHEIVTATDIEQAIAARTYRSNQVEELSQEHIERGTMYIDVTGEVVGQINGLVVVTLGDHTFGLPSRLTARVYMGRGAVVQIDRESKLTGPIHDKGVLILQGYLGGRYAQDYPLTLTASLTFEQNYGGVEGDSASSAELYALLSALSGFPIRQDLAVTGSVNQRGQIQPIGGATQKVEGFFNTCKARGLTGTQGAIIPKTNVKNLMLNNEVVAAVEAGQFHVYAVETIDEGIALLTGQSADAVHQAVDQRLRHLAESLVAFEERR